MVPVKDLQQELYSSCRNEAGRQIPYFAWSCLCLKKRDTYSYKAVSSLKIASTRKKNKALLTAFMHP